MTNGENGSQNIRSKACSKNKESLCGRFLFWKVLSAVLFAGVLVLSYFTFRYYLSENEIAFHLPSIEQKAPYSVEIKEMLAPLRYSGFQRLMKPDVTISLDVHNNGWIIHNVHRFNDKGEIILDEGRYGLCGELAIYMYQKVYPMLKDKYVVEFAKVRESNFFATPGSEHYILHIVDPSLFSGNVYILDPSFNRYKTAGAFDEYYFFEVVDTDKMLDLNMKDELFPVGIATPLIIKKNYLVQLGVEKIDNKFDRNNFCLSLFATKRHAFSGRYILSLRKVDGKTSVVEDMMLAKMLFEDEEYKRLRDRIEEFFQNM